MRIIITTWLMRQITLFSLVITVIDTFSNTTSHSIIIFEVDLMVAFFAILLSKKERLRISMRIWYVCEVSGDVKVMWRQRLVARNDQCSIRGVLPQVARGEMSERWVTGGPAAEPVRGCRFARLFSLFRKTRTYKMISQTKKKIMVLLVYCTLTLGCRHTEPL